MISTHVLDTTLGAPAAGIGVKLQKKNADLWIDISSGMTNTDGRFVFDNDRTSGIYQIIFEIEEYQKRNFKDFFFLNTPVIFKIEDTNRKYHVPLLLNPFGHSTYRGS